MSEDYGLGDEDSQESGQNQEAETQPPDLASQISSLQQRYEVLAAWANQATGLINQGQPKEVNPMQQQINAMERAIADLVNNYKTNNKSWGEYQTQYQQQQQQMQQMQYDQQARQVAEYAAQVSGEVNDQLEQEGYPGFNTYAGLVRDTIINEIPWAQDNPEVFKAQLEIANRPEFWGHVYINHIAPQLASFNTSFRRAGNAREASAENLTSWTNDDYMRMRAQTNRITE